MMPNSGGPLAAVAPAHPDWLFHHLRIEGPAEAVAAFRAAASGAGLIPWQLDFDRVEEDAFLRLAAPQGQPRLLSLESARMLAAELRDAVARRHALTVARVGHEQKCCWDLHALVPVPGDILRLGPDHPDALRWLWEHWGTTETLRHVAPAPDRDETASRDGVPGQLLVGRLDAVAGDCCHPGALSGAAGGCAAAVRAHVTTTVPDRWENPPRRPPASAAPVLTVAGFEGPLDWLLEMARAQRIDLATQSIVELVDAFVAALDAALRVQEQEDVYQLRFVKLWRVPDAIGRITRMLEAQPEGGPLAGFLPRVDQVGPEKELRCRAAVASTFLAGLELAREGTVRLRQEQAWHSININR